MRPGRRLLGVIGIVGAVLLLLLVFDLRVLIGETKVQPGQKFLIEDYGDLGHNQQGTLVCRYFTGRSVKTIVFWYSPSNVLGKDECPFLIQDD